MRKIDLCFSYNYSFPNRFLKVFIIICALFVADTCSNLNLQNGPLDLS